MSPDGFFYVEASGRGIESVYESEKESEEARKRMRKNKMRL